MKLKYVGGLPGVDGSRKMEIRRTGDGIKLFRGGFRNRWLEIRREDVAISYLPDLREASKKGSNIFAGASLGVGLATGGAGLLAGALGAVLFKKLGKKKIPGIGMQVRLENGATVGVIFEAKKMKQYNELAKLLG